MTAEIKIRRGTKVQLPSLDLSEPGFSTDTKELYVGDGIGNIKIGSDSFLELNDSPNTYSGTAGKCVSVNQSEDGLILTTLSGSGDVEDIPLLQIRRTGDLLLGTSWQDISFDYEDLSINTSYLEHDSVDIDRILIRGDGIYSFNVSTIVTTTNSTKFVYYRLIKNDLDVLDSSYFFVELSPNETHEISREMAFDLSTGDYITLQMYRGSGSGKAVVEEDALILVKCLKSLKGDKGDIGPPGILTIEDSAYFDVYDSAGGMSLSSSWQDLNFNTVRKNSGDFNIVGNKEIVIPRNSVYNVNVRVTTGITSESDRSDSKIRLMLNSGSGYTEIPGSLSYIYNRRVSQGIGTTSINVLEDFNSGDKIKVQVAVNSGGSSIETVVDASSISVFIPGGVPGEDGVDGAPGSGSSVIVKDDGTNVVNTPHSSLNFVGDLVECTDEGSGMVNVFIQSTTLVFGSEFYYDNDETTASTNSTSYVNRFTTTIDSIPVGTYRITWYFEIFPKPSWNSEGMDFRIVVDNTNTIMEELDQRGSRWSTNFWGSKSGFCNLSLYSGSHNIELDYLARAGSCSIRRVRIEFWRVA